LFISTIFWTAAVDDFFSRFYSFSFFSLIKWLCFSKFSVSSCRFWLFVIGGEYGGEFGDC